VPVFIKNSELNQYILKVHFSMFSLPIHIAVKGFWQHANGDPTLSANNVQDLPPDLNSNAT
jgi:hypothetical protein